MTGSQPQPDPIAQLADATADLEEAQPEGVNLHGAARAVLDQPVSQRIEQPVGRGMQQAAETGWRRNDGR